MMQNADPSPIQELFHAIANGLSRPQHAWQAVVIVAALVAAWFAERALAQWGSGRASAIANGDARHKTLPATIDGLLYIAYPLFSFLLLWIGEGVLRVTHVIASGADARLIRFAAVLVGTLAVVRLLFYLLRHGLRSATLIVRFERAIAAVALAGTALYATGAWGDVVAWLAATRIPLGNTAVSVWALLVGSVTTLSALLAAMWAGSLVEERLSVEPELDPNLRLVLGRVARAAFLVVGILFALAVSGIDLTILSVFGGALGVGLGLGLQRIVSNYVSGFILLLDRSLRIGDIVAADKYQGEVTRITARYTLLRASDGTEATVPNEILISQPVVNTTLTDRRVNLHIRIAVRQGRDAGYLQAELEAAAASVARVLADPAPEARLIEFPGGNLLWELRFWIADPESGTGRILSDVAKAAYERLRAGGIELAPQTL